MIAAELRFAGNVAAAVVLLLGLGIGAVALQRVTHFSSAASIAIAVTIGAAMLFAAFCFWLRRTALRPAAVALPQNAAKPVVARWVPAILSVVAFGCCMYVVVDSIVRNRIDGNPLPQAFYPCIFTLLFMFFSEGRQWLARRSGREIAVFDEKRLARSTAALALPTRAEYLRESRPLRVRGLIRLALFGVAIVTWALLAPRFGAGIALVISVPSVAAIFLLLHKLIDL